VTRPDIANVPSSAAIASAAADFDKLAPAVDDVMNTVNGAWSRLSVSDVFETPDSDQVVNALSGPTTLSSTIGQDAAAVKKALDDYASALADLERRRSALVEEHAVADLMLLADPFPAAASAGTPAGDSYRSKPLQQQFDLDARVTQFNEAVDQADVDCAVALVKLGRDPVTQATNAARQVGVVMDDPRVVFGQEMVARGLYVSTEIKPTFQAIMEAKASGQALFKLSPPDLKQLGRDVWASMKPFSFGPDHVDFSAAESWGRRLGVAGTVVSGVTTFADEWNKGEARHPEWDGATRVRHAAIHTVVKTAGAVAGAEIGSGVGQAVGVAVGEAIFPLGGGLIGGFVGGVLGGAIGGEIGGDLAGGVVDKADS
jgi:hypothetical protein